MCFNNKATESGRIQTQEPNISNAPKSLEETIKGRKISMRENFRLAYGKIPPKTGD